MSVEEIVLDESRSQSFDGDVTSKDNTSKNCEFFKVLDNRFITDNRKARQNKSRTYAEVLRSGEKHPIMGGKNIFGYGENTIDFEAIKRDLLSCEKSSTISSSPPVVCTNSSVTCNSSETACEHFESFLESTQEKELLEILEELQNQSQTTIEIHHVSTSEERIKGYFCSDTVFNLSNRVLSDNEIKVLEKGLDFAPIQRKINEPELRRDFDDFCRRMRIKWNFRNEPSTNFSKSPSFSVKSSWKPPKGHANLEVFLSQLENEIFNEIKDTC